MKLPSNAIISERKLTEYLLSYRKRNDKSKWLLEAGYHTENWKRLQRDIRNQLLTLEAVLVEENQFGIVMK